MAQYLVDEEFQASVQKIYEIDPVSNKGKVQSFDDEKAEVGSVEYMRGPVKLMERARAKAQNEYASEPYPASACVIDFNRCALIFEDISSLLRGLQQFVNKVKYYQSGNIIAIARDKNGFIEYVKEAQYADIKLNVVIKGKHNSIIGEVQFLLRAMKEYKDKAHNLYAIQRKEQAIRSSVSKTLPILLDQERNIISVACRGSVKRMCSLMITQNQTFQDLMFVDKASRKTILHIICHFAHLKLLKFLQSVMPRKEFLEQIFLSDISDTKPIEYSVLLSNSSVVEYLFSMPEVQDRYKNNDPLIFRLCLFLFGVDSNPQITEYVMSALQISKQKIVQMLSYQCPEQGTQESHHEYHKWTIFTCCIWWGSYDDFKRLVDFVGKQAFIDNAFNVDGWDKDVLRYCMEKKNMKILEYVLSFEEVRERYMSDDDVLCLLVETLNDFIDQREFVKFIVDTLGLTEAKLNDLSSFRSIDVDDILPFTQ